MSTPADSAREAARRPAGSGAGGQFGTQPLAEETGVDLTATASTGPDASLDASLDDGPTGPPSPLDDCVWTSYADLRPGDRFLREQYSPDGDAFVEVEVLSETPAPAEDRFGRAMENLTCRRLDTGAEGTMMFGPGGKVRKANPAPSVATENDAWDHVRLVAPGEPVTLLTGPDASIRVTISGSQEEHHPGHRRSLVPGEPAHVTLRDPGDPAGPPTPDVTGAYRVVGSGIDREFGYDAGRRHDAQWAAAAFVARLGRDESLLLRDADRSAEA